MDEVMQALLTVSDGWERAFLIFCRVAAFSALLPGFGERSVPMRIKLGLAVAFTAIVAPAVPGEMPSLMVLAMSAEMLSGLIFGLTLRLFLLALQTAGAMAAQATSLSQLLGNNGADPMPAMGHILVVGSLALAVIAGLHIKAAQFLVLTYDLVPLATFPAPDLFADWGTGQVGRAFSLAFSLATPFIILSMVYNLTLGAINRAMPQLMVAFVGAPLITAGGLIVFCFAAPIMMSAWLAALDQFMAAPTGGIR